MNERTESTPLLIALLVLGFLLFMFLCVALSLTLITAIHGHRAMPAQVTPLPPASIPAQSRATSTPPPTVVRTGPVPYSPDEDLETRLLTQIYEQANPSVVNIQTDKSEGSGFVWDGEGHIVTNFHVVHGAEHILVTFADNTQAKATLVGEDADSDLAVIRVNPQGLTLYPVILGDSLHLKVGERAIAIGNPFGLAGSMTAGIISALGRSIEAPSNYLIPEAIQTDAPVNPGNSGGPLLNARGEVIGIVSQIRSPVRGNTGVGFAIPIHIAKRVVPVLIEKGHYEHPFLGISGVTLSAGIRQELNLPPDLEGAYVNWVIPGYPAAKAGIRGGETETDYIIGFDDNGRPLYLRKGGDVILAINDQPIRRFDDILVYLIRYASPGDRVVLTVWRDGKTLKIPVTLGVRPRRD